MADVTAKAGTGLSPEWDRWFDEEFTDLIAGDEELLRAEFDDLIASAWPSSPSPPAPSSDNAAKDATSPDDASGSPDGTDRRNLPPARPPPR